ncbi:MAG: nuclear transport factor 2 family protein [Solirubrobacteraceae bacterium]
MSTPIETMQAYIAAAHSGDFSAAYRFYARDIVGHVPGRSAFAGELRGKAAVVRYIETARAISERSEVEVDVVDMLASDERVALIVREVFHLPSGDVEIRRSNVYRVAGDEITEIWIYEANQYEADELFAAEGAAR